MEINYDESGISGNCPVQAEGTINGLPFYFRSRGGHWSLAIAKHSNGNALDYKNCYYLREEYNGVNRDEPQDFHGHMVQFGAGWAEKDECKAFIERAAKILLGDNA